MNRLEAKAIIENTGNYSEEDYEAIIGIYDGVVKHIGFEDNRRDKRYVVKFHDIFYYMPDDYARENDDVIEMWFEEFCNDQYEMLESIMEENWNNHGMLSDRNVGHYPAFIVQIDNITEENAVEVAMKIYDEFGYEETDYVDDYVKIVDAMQDLEDNYMEYWIEFIEANEAFPEKEIKEIKEAYERDKERKKQYAEQTKTN